MHSLELSVLSRLVVGRHIRTEFMLPPEEVGQRFAGGLARLQAAGRRECHRIVGGNDQLAKRLAAQLGDAGALANGRAVDRRRPRGEITLKSGEVIGAGTSRRGGAVARAVSHLGRRCRWSSVRSGYGVGGKISVQFDRRIWQDYGRNGTVLTERAWGHLWETTDDQSGDRGVLTNLLSSHDGAAFAALPEAPDRIVAEIDRLFPGAKGLAGERVHTDWTNDPWSLGAYSCFGPGQMAAAEPLMRLRARSAAAGGEHTDDFSGFMEGALRSGARVASTITE